MTLSSTSPPVFFITTTRPVEDEDTSTESSPSSTEPARPSSSSSSTSSSPSSFSPISDSGVTRTIPNDSTVTVTRHTTITRELPSTTTDSPSTTEAAPDPTSSTVWETPAPTPTDTAASNPNANKPPPSGGINTGAVVGIALGGVFAAVLIVVLLWLWRSRRNRAVEETEDGNAPVYVDKSKLRDSIFGRRPTSASLPRHPTPHQASGQGYGYDPFAPFGGRADQPARTAPPPYPDAYEMDGRGVHVAELPGTAMTTADDATADVQRPGPRFVGPLEQRPNSDPRATLKYLPRENGRPTYINHWNQYKTLAGETRTRQ